MWYQVVQPTALILLCFLTSQNGITKLAQAQKPSQTSHLNNDITQSAEQTTTSLDQRISDIDQRIDQIDSQIQTINANLKQVLERVPTVSEVQATNAELRRMLANFECFFGSLYAEKPEAFDPEAGAETRMSKLNEYLGNREAELSGLRPSPITVTDNDDTFDPELLGRALGQIVEENSKLAEKVQKLQAKVDITLPKKDVGRDDITTNERTRRSPRDLRSQNTTDGDVIEVSEEALSTVERMVAEELFSLLSSLNDSTASSSSSSLLSRNSTSSQTMTYADITDDSLSTEEEIDLLLGISPPSRRRKSAFSAARTTSMMGSSMPQVVTFDHIYVNKGRDFLADNHTFICEIAGFYFISFNLRSFDGRHLGVSLMKNDDVMTAIYSDASERNVMESQSVILHLERGDRLYLRLGPSESYGLYSDTRKYCTFNGFLLYRGY